MLVILSFRAARDGLSCPSGLHVVACFTSGLHVLAYLVLEGCT